MGISPGWVHWLPHGGKEPLDRIPHFPSYKRAYLRAFGMMMTSIQEQGITTRWKDAEDVFAWWMEDKNTEGQISLSDLELWRAENEKWE